MGLRWRDLDLDLAALSVVQTLYKRQGVYELKNPKSKQSQRSVALTPSLALFFRQYRKEKQSESLVLGKPLEEDSLVFSRPDGSPTDPGTLTHAFARIARRTGLPHARFHDLRHTHATLMLVSGVHPKIVQERLGHASVAFTLDVYSHSVAGLQEAAARRLDEVLQPKLAEMEHVGRRPCF